MVKTGAGAAVYIASPPPITFTDEATIASADCKVYTIAAAEKRYWDPAVAVTVKKNDAIITSGFTIQHVGGKVIFDTALESTDVVTISGGYLPVSRLGEAKEWSLDVDTKILDATKLGDAWENKVVGQRSVSVKLSKWWVDGFFLDQLTNLLVVVLYIDSTVGTRYEAYARIKSDSIKTVADGLVEEDISLEVEGEIYYVAA